MYYKHRKTIIGGLIVVFTMSLSIVSAEKRVQKRRINHPPKIVTFSSAMSAVYLCPWATCSPEIATFNLVATDSDHDRLQFTCAVPVGILSGCGPSMSWDLRNVPRGTHTISVTVTDGHGGEATTQLAIIVADCGACDPPPPPCPTITISTANEATDNRHLSFTVKTEGAEGYRAPSFNWTTSVGKIINGQNTNKVEIDASGLEGEELRVTVSVGGFDPSCMTTVSKQFVVKKN